MFKINNEGLFKSTMYNCSKDCTRTMALWPHLTVAKAYARGIVSGAVSVMMATGMSFEESIEMVKKYLPENFDLDAVPEYWQDSFNE